MDTTFHLLPWGKGEIVREGETFAILAIGNMVYPSIAAAELAAKEGLNVRVINARFLKPIDAAWLRDALNGIQAVVTVEENVLAGGFGSAIREILGSDGPVVHSLGIPDRFVEQGPQPKLRELVGLTDRNIADTVLRIAFPGRFDLPSASADKLTA